MIKLIYGEKGTGKTKQIIDQANASVADCKGSVVFLTDSNKYIFSISHKIRLINSSDYEIQTELGLLGFIRGLIAADNDIQYIYIDGAARMANLPVDQMENFYNSLEKLTEKNNVKLILTVSISDTALPAFLRRFI